jgi:hypothetical protein
LHDFGEFLFLPIYAIVDPACANGGGSTACDAAASTLLGGVPSAANRTVFGAAGTWTWSFAPPVDVHLSVGANASAVWIGSVVAEVHWAPLLEQGLNSAALMNAFSGVKTLPSLGDIDIAVFNAASTWSPMTDSSVNSIANASMFGFRGAEVAAAAASTGGRDSFLGLYAGPVVSRAAASARTGPASLAASPAALADFLTGADRAATQSFTFGARTRVLAVAARRSYVDARRTLTPVWVLLLSLAATNLKDLAVAVVLVARFLYVRRRATGEKAGGAERRETVVEMMARSP